MDIRDEIKLSKGDMLSDSDQNRHRNKLPGVKAIDPDSSIKSKSKDTGKSNSPKSRKESEKATVVKKNFVVSKSKVAAVSIEKSTVVKERDVTSKVSDGSNKAAVVAPVIEKVPVATETDKETEPVVMADVKALVVAVVESVVEKDNPKFTSKVLDESVKVALVAPVIENVSVAMETDKETEPVVVADVKASVVASVESVVEKDNPKVMSKVSDESVKEPVIKESVKVPVVKKSVKASSVVTDKPSSVVTDKKSVKASSVVADKPSSVVADKVDVVKDKIDVVKDKVDVASDALKNKPTRKGKKPVVGKDKDKPKNIAPDVVKEKFKPNPKQKVISLEIPVLRFSKHLEFKAKVNVKRKMILSKKDDRKKKLKGKSKKDVSDFELETDVVDYSSDEADRKRKKLKIKAGLKRKRSGSDSSELDTKSIKRLISKLEKKVKKQESDEDSVPKKGKKKLTKKVKKEESDEESIPKKGKKKEKQLTSKEVAHEEYLSSFPSFHARTTPSPFYAIKNSRVDILRFLTDIGFSSLHNVFVDRLSSKLGWFAVFKFISYMLSFDSGDKIEVTPSKIHDMLGVPFGGRLRQDSVISDIDWREYIYDCLRDTEESLSLICAERVILEDYIRKASLKCHSDGKFVALHEKYFNLFKDPISFEDDGNEDNVGDDDDENEGDDGGNVDNDVNDCDENEDEEDVNEGDKDLNGSNLSFDFSKISLEDFGNDSGPAEKDKVVEGNPTEQGTVAEGNEAEECEIMSIPENFTQWLEIADLVGEGDLFGDNSVTLEAMNQEITPEKLPTQKGSPSPKKRDMKPSSYLLSPYMNKKTNIVPKITRLEFILGNNLFTMEGDKMKFIVYGVRLNLETLAPGLWLDANVIDCWGTSNSMFDGTLASFDAKWKSFSNQVNAQFKDNKAGLALGGIDLRDMLRRLTFKFATKILSHEINVHAGKMLELAKKFDKTDPVEKMTIIVDAFKKNEE
nr:hypothetical protein [Tanacetum cinerariifolium]